MSKKNIALVGHMGSGKTLLGKLIAKKLKYNHVDSDTLIEKQSKMKIKEIFELKGEQIFRTIEEKTILGLQNKEKIVLSLGGGSILSKNVRKLLKKDYFMVFLDVDLKILMKRLEFSTRRPLLFNINKKEKIQQLDLKRRKYYSLADITIYNHNSPEETLKDIIREYNLI